MCIVDAMVHRPHDRRSMDLLRESRQQLAHLISANRRRDRLKLTPDTLARFRLHVPHIEMARTTVEEQNNARVSSRFLCGGLV